MNRKSPSAITSIRGRVWSPAMVNTLATPSLLRAVGYQVAAGEGGRTHRIACLELGVEYGLIMEWLPLSVKSNGEAGLHL